MPFEMNKPKISSQAMLFHHLTKMFGFVTTYSIKSCARSLSCVIASFIKTPHF